jgi:CBS-domain-containing membrane protein
VARRRSLFRMLARGVLFAGLALALAFIGLVALYSVEPPVSTLMLARTLGRSYERVYGS